MRVVLEAKARRSPVSPPAGETVTIKVVCVFAGILDSADEEES